MANRRRRTSDAKANHALKVEQYETETTPQATARKLLQPTLKNAAAASAFTDKMVGGSVELPGIGDYADHVHSVVKRAPDGDIRMASEVLAAQAIALDSMFAELARRAAINMGDYINASERYGRLALKAQSNCRATLEALAKLHQPREQIVKHVHVNEGGQAVVADQFHHHNREGVNEKSVEQSHATSTTGSGPAMLGQDAQGDELPISGSEGQEAMPNARRNQSRRT